MAIYRYTIINTKGKKIRGALHATSFLVARERLHREKVCIIKLQAKKSHRKERRIPVSVLQHLFKELGYLLRAGLSLHEALVAMREKTRTSPLHSVLQSLSDQIQEGKSFSEALSNHSKTFDPVIRCTISTGEKSGALEQTFDAIAELIKRSDKHRKQWIEALIYPLLLLGLSLCIFAGLLLFVIPSLRELLEECTLHPLTSFLLAFSNWANAHIVLFFLMPCLFFTLLYLLVSIKHVKWLLSMLVLRIPLIKSLFIHGSLERFCHNASILLRGGTPLMETIAYSIGALHPLMQVHFSHVQQKIAQGESLSYALRYIPNIPSLFLRVIALAEETGQMAEAFLHLGSLYEEEMNKHLKGISALLQPLFLVLLGGIVGLVVFSVLLPLTDASAFFR